MTINRRDFIKTQAIAAAAATAGVSLPALAAKKEAAPAPADSSNANAVALGQGAVPLLRHRLFGAGRRAEWPRGGHSGRSGCTGQSWPELYQGATSCPRSCTARTA